MDEDVSIIDANTRNEKIKNFFINNKKKIIILILMIILFFMSFFGFKEFQNKQKINISNLYNSAVIDYDEDTKNKSKDILLNVVYKKDPTYSPLSLYFIIDNKLIEDKKKINELFDVIINETSLEKEIKNLIIYKKGLYNADNASENELLKILGTLINSESIWSSHALYLMAEYFYSKKELQKSKEFFNKIINLNNSNVDIKIKAQKRLVRDLSD
jgi:predicted negative regulator of RcsB-dependent stress response